MTEHRLSEGRAKVFEEAALVEIEPWTQDRGGTMRFFKEDADVLRYLADCLEHFDVPRPAEEDEGQQEEDEPETERKPAEIVKVDGQPAAQSVQDWALR